jgi:hypothetical protein
MAGEEGPRFLQRGSKSEEGGVLENLLGECKQRMKFKFFRVKIVDEMRQMKHS